MTGEEPEYVHMEEKARVALVTFAASAIDNEVSNTNEDALLWDVPSPIHRLHQFGSGRYRFFVELPDHDEDIELFKPIHPFQLQWEVLTHPGTQAGGGGGGKKGGAAKKPASVKGMC